MQAASKGFLLFLLGYGTALPDRAWKSQHQAGRARDELKEESVSIYRMSEAGNCPKALAAARLGYEPIPDTEYGERIMRESSRHEDWVVDDLRTEGWVIQRGGVCMTCPDNRKGIHVELSSYLIKLVGHLVGRVRLPTNPIWHPLEIKALGRFTFAKFKQQGFAAFPDYDAQMSVYLAAEQLPGIYVVKCRDTGELLRYEVPYAGGSEVPYASARLTELPLLETHTDVPALLDSLSLVELSVQVGELPECTRSEEQRRYCAFRYLCDKGTSTALTDAELTDAALTDAAAWWKEGKELEHLSEELLDKAKAAFLQQAGKTPKFTIAGLSVVYGGEKTRRFLSEQKLRQLVAAEVLEQAYQESKPYPDLRVRLLKEE